MKWHKWIVGVRNSLASMAAEMDSMAAINGAQMTPSERKKYQDALRKIVSDLDKDLRS